jgi:integration host factor subunit beta
MTRSELVTLLASRFPQFLRKDSDQAVNEILSAVGQTLSDGRRVEIRGFGSFSLNYQAPRLRRNPKTGESFTSSGKSVPHFKAGKELREAGDYAADNQAEMKRSV